MVEQGSQTGRIAAVIAIAAIAYFAIAAVATHLVSPQYDFVRDYISDYAVGPNGWIYGSAFLASCIGSIALAIALWQNAAPAAVSRSGAILLVIVGITYAVDFMFPTDILAPGQPPQTMVGVIHLLDAFLGWLLFVVAAFLVTRRLKMDAYFARWHAVLLALTWLTLALLIALAVVVVAKLPIGGLAEKSFILVRNVWALLVAVLVLRAPGRNRPA